MSDIVVTAVVAAAAVESVPELYVVFKVADAEYALPAETILQMESYTLATRVPGTAAYIAGIIQIRGRVVPVMDLRLRFGLPAIPHTIDSRVVVGQHGDRAIALLVDSAREVLKISKGQLKPPPRLLEDGSTGFVKALAQVGKRMVMIVDFAKVIGEEALDVG